MHKEIYLCKFCHCLRKGPFCIPLIREYGGGGGGREGEPEPLDPSPTWLCAKGIHVYKLIEYQLL